MRAIIVQSLVSDWHLASQAGVVPLARAEQLPAHFKDHPAQAGTPSSEIHDVIHNGLVFPAAGYREHTSTLAGKVILARHASRPSGR